MNDPLDIGQYGAGFRSPKNENANFEDQESRKCPSMIEDQHLKTLERNPYQSVRKMSQAIGVSILIILDGLDKWVPHEFSVSQRAQHFEVCSRFLWKLNDPFLDQILTYVKKWIMTIINDQLKWLDHVRHSIIFQNQKFINIRLQWLTGRSVVSFPEYNQSIIAEFYYQ